ncbi:MAG TPA: RHS repeat-associated core domain-containing protein [Solirubrobacteraceae bacterium]|nr:RHS repeat-associated core domain-containing protein [Solirubrobacteraceae bacterium]
MPGFEQLTGAQQAGIAERVRRTDPVAIATRSVSRHAFSGLGATAAARVARQAFPNALAVSSPTDTAMLARGQRITRYLSDHAASLDLGHGKHGVLESSVPIATLTPSGRAVPLDLRLRHANGGFEPSVAASRVLLHSRADAGVTLTDTGLSIAPAQSDAGSAGVLDGGGVLYANTQTDADTLFKPVAQGVAVDGVLRSAASPQRLSFAVSGPGSVRLRTRRSGVVSISLDGDVVASVLPPLAQDATGTPVPVTMSVSRDRLVLDIAHRNGDFQYPIEVDPIIEDKQIIYGNWSSETSNPMAFSLLTNTSTSTLTDTGNGTYSVGQWGAWAYETQGVSKIEAIGVEATSVNPGNDIENRLLIAGKTTGIEGQEVQPSNFGLGFRVVQVAGSAGNAAEFGQWATKTGNSFVTTIFNASVRIVQESSPTVEADTTDVMVESHTNVAHTGGWLGGASASNTFGVRVSDAGIGVHEIKARSPQVPGVEHYVGLSCLQVQCLQELKGGLYGVWYPDGEDTVEVIGSNATHGDTITSLKVKVDTSAPHDVAIAGLPANAEIGDSVYKLSASASDGAGAVPSSGLAPLAITIDGIPFGSPQGGCSVGPCSTTGEWTISGSQFAVGQHQLVLAATDKAGNKTVKEMALFVTRPVSPVSVGPAGVNPESGELTLQAADVSITAPGDTLSVARSYGSEHLTAGAEGPLGSSWILDLGGAAQSIVKLPSGSVLLGSGGELQSVFTPKGAGEYTAPKGNENLKLLESTVEGKVQFQLSSGGSTTTFKLPAGGTGNTWVPTSESEPNNTNVKTYSYQVAGSVIEPTEVLAPVAANVTCTTTLVRGCRALRFVYASSTTATGEGASEWGDYTGRLKQVTFTAWDPATSAMSTTTVAQYSYDVQGRLRAEWDPRVSPALKTTYGYDVEGRVTSLVSPGEQPWLFTYGTGIGDIRTGHLLKVTRPAPTTAAGSGVTPQNTALPALSSTNAPEGKTLTVTAGTWSNTPLAYGYQWEECQTISSAEVCALLPGATNASYRSTYHGPNRWLKVLVTAINANGATTVATASTGVVLPNTYMEKTGEFATKGSGNGQLNNPSGIATDSAGNVWVADTANNRVEKFSAAGAFIAAYGTLGSGNLQFKGPSGIAIDNVTGTVWVADTGNSRIEGLTSAGALAGLSPTGAGTAPQAIAITKSGTEETIAVGVGSQIATFHGTPKVMIPGTVYGGAGTGNGQFTGVGGLAADEGASKLYATDVGGHRVEVFSTTSGLIYQSQYGTSGTGEGHLGTPQGLALQSGNVFVADKTNANVQKFSGSSPLQLFTEAAGVYGVATYPKASDGSMYVLNQTTGKIAKWVTATRPAFVPTPPSPGTSAVWTAEYGVPISGAGAPYAMSSTDVAKWGQTDVPVEAMAVLPPDSPQGWPASSYTRATVHYLDSDGRTVNTATPGGGIDTTEYNSKNDVVRTLSPINRAKALTESKPLEVSQLLDTQSTYSEDGSELLSTMGPQHTVKLANGSQVLARHKTRYFYDEGAPGTGGPYHLVTKLTEGALLTSGTEEDVHTTVNSYAGQEGLGWKLHVPTSITTDPTGLKIVRTKLYDPTTGYVTDAIMPSGNPAGGDSHDTQTIYYTALANAKAAVCGLHPEWANLPCQTKLAKNPETAGVPNPPVTTVTYNLWDEGVETNSVVGAESRKLVQTYDSSGRPKTATATSTTGTALPAVTFGYDSVSGKLVTSSTTEGSTTRTLTSVYDKWGQLAEYTDADGVISKYTHDIDGREVTADDGKGTQTFIYNSITGAATTLIDSAVGVGAEYDIEGKIKTEVLPNGLYERYTYDATGQLTGLQYVKETNCSSNCTWYSDNIVPSITGQWLTRSSTLSAQTYKYDTAGRLTQVQDTPSGVGCTTRLYAYDADGNRTGQTTRNPGAGGACATEGGTTVSHTYDPADRLTDTGAAYDAFGDTTSTPAGDAGGTTLTSSFYTTGLLASQTQNGQTNGFHIDPAGRLREMVATGTKTLTSITHYGGMDDSPSWTAEGATGWTRDVVGLSGSLIATQTNGEAPIVQITNLHGDVVATASLSESATGLSSTNDTTEYGVPRTSTQPKYAWLGGSRRQTTLASGVIAMGARSYVPQIGRFLQTDPVAGGSANAYAYGSDDPVNNTDPSGESTTGLSSWLHALNDQIGQEIVVREAAREAAARAAAEAAAAAAAAAAEATPGEYEAGPIYVDPLHKKDLTPTQAVALARAIRNGGKVLQELISHYFGSIAGYLAEFTAKVLSDAADNLEVCGDALMSNPRNRCRVEIPTIGLWTPAGTVDLYIPFGSITIRPCFYIKKSQKGLKRGLRCSPDH